MREFHSIFYKKNKLIIITFIIYVILTSLLSVVLIVGSYNQYYIQCIGFTIFLFAMSLRAAYFIFEKISIDTDRKEIRLHILQKKIAIQSVESIKKVRMGQIRIIHSGQKILSISIDNENEFILSLQYLNKNIKIE